MAMRNKRIHPGLAGLVIAGGLCCWPGMPEVRGDDGLELDLHSMETHADESHTPPSGTADHHSATDHTESGGTVSQPHPVSHETHQEEETHGDDHSPAAGVGSRQASQGADQPFDTRDIRIGRIDMPTPISDKSLTNEYVTVPVRGNQTILEMARFWEDLSTAQKLRTEGMLDQARVYCVQLLEMATPDEINRLALLELSYVLEEQGDLPAANQVLSQYILYYNKADNIAEAYLRQGRILRELGSNDLAIGKFYSSMSSTINFGADGAERYRRIALLAQTEIAQTHYLGGKFQEAIDTYQRILKDNQPDLDRKKIRFNLLRAMLPESTASKILAAARNFLKDHGKSEYAPEVTFIQASKELELGHEGEMMETVLNLLKSRPQDYPVQPEQLLPWQHKAGNLLANALFEKGDYMAARSIYGTLIRMDPGPRWVIPATYQYALCSERLDMIDDATDAYMQIMAIGHNLDEGEKKRNLQIRTLLDMAEFRLDQLNWLSEARDKGRSLLDPSAPPARTQPIDDERNLKWLGSVYSRMDDTTAAKILSKMEATDTTAIISTMGVARQGSILRRISSLGPDEKSLAAAVAASLGLPKQLAEIPPE